MCSINNSPHLKKELTLSVSEDCLKLKEMSVKISIWISIKHDQISVCDLTFFVFVENNAVLSSFFLLYDHEYGKLSN